MLQLARQLGFSPVDLGGLCASRDIEEAPLILFPSWEGPILATFLLFLFFYGYNIVRSILLPYLDRGENNFYQLPLETVNEAMPAVALVTLALVYLPGIEKRMLGSDCTISAGNSPNRVKMCVWHDHLCIIVDDERRLIWTSWTDAPSPSEYYKIHHVLWVTVRSTGQLLAEKQKQR